MRVSKKRCTIFYAYILKEACSTRLSLYHNHNCKEARPLRESNPCSCHEKAMSSPLDERDKGNSTRSFLYVHRQRMLSLLIQKIHSGIYILSSWYCLFFLSESAHASEKGGELPTCIVRILSICKSTLMTLTTLCACVSLPLKCFFNFCCKTCRKSSSK